MKNVKFSSGLYGILLLWSRDFYLGRYFEKMLTCRHFDFQGCCLAILKVDFPFCKAKKWGAMVAFVPTCPSRITMKGV